MVPRTPPPGRRFVSQTSSTASEKAYAAGHASRAALETLRRRARVEAWRAGHRFRKATKEWIAKLIGEEISTWEAEWDALGGAWDRLRWIWNRPQVERIRITLTLANFR